MTPTNDSRRGGDRTPSAAPELLEVTYLAPGRIVVTRDRRVVRAIVGSCVSVSLHDANLRAGGLAHFLLPSPEAGTGTSCRFGDFALDALLDDMKKLGTSAPRLRAGVFGGARVLRDGAYAAHLGERNVEFAFAWLRSRNIAVAARDVLGTVERRLEFRVPDGRVYVHVLGS